ncbi:MAG TPA: hypothetical protein VE547_00975 [Mycobacteriales bacterium]|nr:hypothetical protein [Mycobacteriales bacterium]
MILISLVLVVASAVALGWGIATTTDALVWGSLLAGLLAAVLVAASVVRVRRQVVESPAPPAPSAPAPPAPGFRSTDQDARAPTSWPWPAQPAEPAQGPARSGWTGPVAAPWSTPPPDAVPPVETPAGRGTPPPDTLAPDTSAPDTPAPDTLARDMPEPDEATATAEVAADRAAESGEEGEPPVEQVEIRDALRVAQLADEVSVVDGHPRYHLDGCPTLAGADPVPMPVSTARRAGFTPCGVCGPDRALLARARDRRHPTGD